MNENILYIGGFELPDKNAAAHRVINNAKALKKLDYKVIFLGIDRESNALLSDKCKILFDEKFECWFRSYTSNRLYSIKDVKLLYKKYDGNIKHIIAYNYPSISLLKLIIFCKQKKINLICDCTEWYDTKEISGFKKIIKGMDSSFRMRLLHKCVDGIIVISNFLYNYYSGTMKTLKIPPLCDVNKIENKNPYVITTNPVHLVYSGSPGKTKDKIDIIVESLYRNRDIDFLFSIIGIEEIDYISMYPSHKEIISDLHNKIEFKGRISHDLSLKEIKSADFFMFYRNKSRVTMAGFPTKFAESFSCGVPIITSETSDLNEYLINEVNGFWLAESIEEIDKQINFILNMSKDEINEMHNYCYKNHNKFDFNQYISDFREFLCE